MRPIRLQVRLNAIFAPIEPNQERRLKWKRQNGCARNAAAVIISFVAERRSRPTRGSPRPSRQVTAAGNATMHGRSECRARLDAPRRRYCRNGAGPLLAGFVTIQERGPPWPTESVETSPARAEAARNISGAAGGNRSIMSNTTMAKSIAKSRCGRLPKNWSSCYVSLPGVVQGGTHEQAKDRGPDSTSLARSRSRSRQPYARLHYPKLHSGANEDSLNFNAHGVVLPARSTATAAPIQPASNCPRVSLDHFSDRRSS